MTRSKFIILTTLATLLVIAVTRLSINQAANLELPKNQKVVLIRPAMNGIGNQLFLFAAGYSLAKRLDAKLWVIAKHDNEREGSHTKYALDLFNISYDKLIFMNSKTYKKALSNQIRAVKVVEENFFNISATDGDVFYLGAENNYFASNKFFRNTDDYISHIEFKTPMASTALTTAIANSESVAVHIRLGDYVNEQRNIPILFQIQAMQEMRAKLHNPHFFIFSDDVDFATKAFSGISDTTIASTPENSAINEMQMMSRCKHIITANSTFSWWAAYLIPNPRKIIISPLSHDHNPDFYPLSWLGLDPYAIRPSS